MKWAGNRRAQGEDFFQTPEYAIKPILKYIPKGVKVILEPTAGLNAISEVLRAAGFEVISTDINPRLESIRYLDFLNEVPGFDYDMLIFNPPFSFKNEFMNKAIETGKPFMFICPVNILETATRSRLFEKHKLSIINLSNRINYVGKYEKKPYFHSVWVINDGLGQIHFEEVYR